MTMTRAPIPGTLLAGRYRLVTALPGRGRWRAHDDIRDRDLLAREVALPDADRDQAWQQVLRDAAVVAQKRHPGIVHLVDAVMDEGVAWVLTDVPAGRGLGDLVRRHGPMPPAEVARIGLQALDALVAAGVPHGNLTPDDVLLGPDGQVAVSGFAATGSGAGTRGFQAPEGGTGTKADLWALGATLFVAVEGRMPSGPAVRAGALGPALDGLLTADPDRRVDVAGARRLLEAAAGAPGAASTGPVPPEGGTGPVPPAGPDGRTGAVRVTPVEPDPGTRSGLARSPAPAGGGPAHPPAPGGSGPARPPAPAIGAPARPPAEGPGSARPAAVPAGRDADRRTGPVPPIGPGAGDPGRPGGGAQPSARPAEPDEDVQVHDPDIAAALAALQAALTPVAPPAEGGQSAGTPAEAAGATRMPDPGPASPGAYEGGADVSPEDTGTRPARPGPAVVAGPGPGRPSAPVLRTRAGDPDPASDGPAPEVRAPQRSTAPVDPSAASRQADQARALSRPPGRATAPVGGSPRPDAQVDDTGAAEARATGAAVADQAPAPAEPVTAADRATTADRAAAPGGSGLPGDRTGEPTQPTDRPTTAGATTPPARTGEPTQPTDHPTATGATTPPARTGEPPQPTDHPTATGATTPPARSGGTDTRTTDPGRPSARRRRLAVAAVLLAVLAAVLVPFLLRDGDDDAAAAPPSAPSAPAGATAPPTPAAPSPGAAEPPPAGYQLYRDPAGWSVAVPAGWRPERRGTATTFTDQGRTLKITYRDDPPRDPYEDALRLEPVVTAATPGYDLIRIAAVPYRGWPTADWEYRAGTGVRTRTLTRTVVPTPERGYTISWTTPERTSAADRDYFEVAARTFSPGP